MNSFRSQPERPIETSAEDKLERSRFIERLTAALINPTTRKSTGVVIGITGPWGSGKSSILNLLDEHIRTQYNDALIVRFDPWLVSGRNDLIGEFLGELIGTINADKRHLGKFKTFGMTVAQYGAQLSPMGNLWIPGAGAILSGSFRAMEKALSNKASLSELRAKLIKELEEISTPIVVLIDEIDRVEDGEIRAVAQLVRSVADFPGISYVLAYDHDRVIQALGSDVPSERRDERGKGYLEKIVQLQIPLPVTFDDEITRLLIADLRALTSELGLPNNFESNQRYRGLMQVLIGDVIHTPRDIRRLVGTFHVLAGMLSGEVDWIDLLAYSALLIKSPATVERMRRDPDEFLAQPLSARGIAQYLEREQSSYEERLNKLIPKTEQNAATKALLGFLFPSLSEDSVDEHADAFGQRRPFLSTLRLGLLPGAFSRQDIQKLVVSSPERIEKRLQEAYRDGTLFQLADRLDDVYVDLDSFDHVSFWHAVGAFAKKSNCEWMTSYQPMGEAIDSLASVLQQAVRRSENLRREAAAVFSDLRNAGESGLTARWLRRHIFIHGLFGQEKRGGSAWFLDVEQTKALAFEMAQNWRVEQLSGKLIPCRWDLQPVYTMIDTGVWDDSCRTVLDDALADNRALDGFTLMLFGGAFTNAQSTIAKMCNYDAYIAHVRTRLESAKSAELHETVRVALEKAVGGGWMT
jgi:energy-coupling factor transporter ATP-binding protein EcfA2